MHPIVALLRIQAIHNEMRAFVRGDAPEMKGGDLNEELRAMANMFPAIAAPGDFNRSRLRLNPGDTLPAGSEPGQMNQVFFNLIQNAVDAIEGTGKPGTITLRTEVEREWVRLTVEDTGPGVSAWAREHLFEPFFTTKGTGKGTGLGLATSYQIVRRHRGFIDLDVDYHPGARFVVRLPRTGESGKVARA
jgi:signal transduction histidine kinase